MSLRHSSPLALLFLLVGSMTISTATAAELQVSATNGAEVVWAEPKLIPGVANPWQRLRLVNGAAESARLVMAFQPTQPADERLVALLSFDFSVVPQDGPPPSDAVCNQAEPRVRNLGGTETFAATYALDLTPENPLAPGAALWLCQRVTLSTAADNRLQGVSVGFEQRFTATGVSGQVLGAEDSGVASGVVEIIGSVLGARTVAGSGMPIYAWPLGLAAAVAAFAGLRRLFPQRYFLRLFSPKGGATLLPQKKNQEQSSIILYSKDSS